MVWDGADRRQAQLLWHTTPPVTNCAVLARHDGRDRQHRAGGTLAGAVAVRRKNVTEDQRPRAARPGTGNAKRIFTMSRLLGSGTHRSLMGDSIMFRSKIFGIAGLIAFGVTAAIAAETR